MTTKKWILLFLALAALLAWALLYGGEAAGTVAAIRQDGALVRELDLDAVREAYELTVEYEGRENVLLVEPGRISVLRADCPDQVCVKHGPLESAGDPIVCLPNRLVIQYSEAGAADAVAGR